MGDLSHSMFEGQWPVLESLWGPLGEHEWEKMLDWRLTVCTLPCCLPVVSVTLA